MFNRIAGSYFSVGAPGRVRPFAGGAQMLKAVVTNRGTNLSGPQSASPSRIRPQLTAHAKVEGLVDRKVRGGSTPLRRIEEAAGNQPLD
jgi:hypothetical protein